MSSTFFANPEADRLLESDNEWFWAALLGLVTADLAGRSQLNVVDVGCHRGGLLEQIARRWSVRSLTGIEPLEEAREHARQRLEGAAELVRMLGPADWSSIDPHGADLLTCHEVLYLVSDVRPLLANFRRCLASDGVAYVVLGCHTENPVWPEWRAQLRSQGVDAFDHSPLDILRSAHDAGMAVTMRPLRTDGWVRYDPSRAVFRFPSVHAVFEHHYRHKLVFRMTVR
jgi:SAM-dependent methyltransferase